MTDVFHHLTAIGVGLLFMVTMAVFAYVWDYIMEEHTDKALATFVIFAIICIAWIIGRLFLKAS